MVKRLVLKVELTFDEEVDEDAIAGRVETALFDDDELGAMRVVVDTLED